MQYNDTTTRTGIIQDCEFLTGIGKEGISGNATLLQEFTRLANAWFHKVVTMILKAQDEWDFDDKNLTDYPVATTPMTTARDIVFPASLKILKIKRVDISYDGSTYNRATPIDSEEIANGLGNDTTVDGLFSKTSPKYDPRSNSIWVYPRASQAEVDAGATARVEFAREGDEFTTSDTAQEPGFDEPFHRMIPLGMSFDWAMVKGLPQKNDIFAMLQDYEIRLKDYYGKKVDDRQASLKGAYVNYN